MQVVFVEVGDMAALSSWLPYVASGLGSISNTAPVSMFRWLKARTYGLIRAVKKLVISVDSFQESYETSGFYLLLI
jgi:hypothetical protein